MNPTPEFSHEHPIENFDRFKSLTQVSKEIPELFKEIVFATTIIVDHTPNDSHLVPIILSVIPSFKIKVDPYVEEALSNLKFNSIPPKIIIPTEEGKVYYFITKDFNDVTLLNELKALNNKYEGITFLGLEPETIGIPKENLITNSTGLITGISDNSKDFKDNPVIYEILEPNNPYEPTVIKIKDEVTEIPDNFCEKESLQSIRKVVFPEPQYCNITRIGKYAFNNTKLQEITIPASVKEIDKFAFAYNSDMEYIYIPDSIVNIEEGVFMLADTSDYFPYTEVRLSENLKVIGNYAFSHRNTAVTHIPQSVERIGDVALTGLTIVSEIKEPSPNTDAPSTDSEDPTLTEEEIERLLYSEEPCPQPNNTEKPRTILEIPRNVTSIGTLAFYKSTADELVIPPDSKLESISENAFSSSRFNKITLHAPISEHCVSESVFDGLEMTGNNPKITLPETMCVVPSDTFGFLSKESAKCMPVMIDIGEVEILKSGSFSDLKLDNTSIKSASNLTIEPNSFRNIQSATLAVSARNITISKDAFADSKFLKFILLKADKISIEDGAFNNCPELKGIFINSSPDNLDTAENYHKLVHYTKSTGFDGTVSFTKDSIKILPDVTYIAKDEILRDFSYYLYTRDVVIFESPSSFNKESLSKIPVRKIASDKVSKSRLRYYIYLNNTTPAPEVYKVDIHGKQRLLLGNSLENAKAILKDVYNMNI